MEMVEQFALLVVMTKIYPFQCRAVLGFYGRFRLVRENLESVLFPMSFYHGQVSDFIGGLSGARHQ